MTAIPFPGGILLWMLRFPRKRSRSGDPTTELDSGRYAGKPLLRLLELYVLWAIGELSQETDEALAEIAPKLGETLGHRGTWQEILAQKMDYPPEMPDLLREMWRRNRIAADEREEDLQAEWWARNVVDINMIG